MNTSDLLEQLLSSGLAQQGGAASRASATQGGLGGLLGGALGDLLGGGAAGGGVSSGGGSQGGLGGLGGLLGGLLGGGAPSGQARSSGGMGYGGLATLGMLAFQAFSAWQQQQASARTSMQPETVNQLTGAAAEEHSHAILRALIAASKADGRIDEQEKKLIYAEIAKLTDDPELQDWLDQEVSRPLDAAQAAQAAQTPEMAAEMYLASVLLVGSQQGGERDYLDELARQLKLDPALKVELEAQLGRGLQG